MTPRIKICCIQSEAEAELAIRLGASCVGLVAEMPSGPGPISDERIREIAASVPSEVDTFLLTSRTDPDAIVAHVRACGTTTVQLVDEGVHPETYPKLREDCPGVKIVQVLHVEDESAIDRARALEGRVDALLLDSGRPSAAVPELGGTGRTHDWSVSATLVSAIETPVFLAGGLKATNAREAIDQVRPYGLDLCSGVRTDGSLDEEKLGAFMAHALGRA